jgi:frataxin
MDEKQFETLADRTLEALQARIDEVLGDTVDSEFRGGILTLELEDGRQYVVNKHAPNRQIWLSSPVSGAAHFNPDEAGKVWRSTRGGPALHDLLAAELSELAGQSLTFD